MLKQLNPRRVGAVVAPLLTIVLIAGCSSVTKTLTGGAAVAYSNAERAEEKARAIDDRAERKKALTEAYDKYMSVVTDNPDDVKFGNRARYAAAQIQKELVVAGGANYETATNLLNEIGQLRPTGYLAGLARSEISAIRQNRQRIADARSSFDNTPENASVERRLEALNSLMSVARSYEGLKDYDSAIDTYKRVIEVSNGWSEAENDEFYKKAAQAQFQVGGLYFYRFHDYTQTGGWGAYAKVMSDYPKSFEAEQVNSLLKRANASLTEIQQDQAYITSKLNQKAWDYRKIGRHVTPNELFSVYSEQVAQAYLNIARRWEKDPLRNFPAAIDNYRQLVELLWSEMFVASEAAFHIGRLYQDDGQYLRAVEAYNKMFKDFPQASRRNEAVYNRAVCYETTRDFERAYREYKAAMGLGEDESFYRAAEQKVRQFETDDDGDGYKFYEEQEAGTSDKDANAFPGSMKIAEKATPPAAQAKADTSSQD